MNLMEQSWQSRSAAPEQPHNGRLAEAARPERRAAEAARLASWRSIASI
jgi:hypothetical protein